MCALSVEDNTLICRLYDVYSKMPALFIIMCNSPSKPYHVGPAFEAATASIPVLVVHFSERRDVSGRREREREREREGERGREREREGCVCSDIVCARIRSVRR